MFGRIKSIFRGRKAPTVEKQRIESVSQDPCSPTRRRAVEKVTHFLENGTTGEKRKRSGDSATNEGPQKRARRSRDTYTPSSEEDEELEGTTLNRSRHSPTRSPSDKDKVRDRLLMPPPSMTKFSPRKLQPRSASTMADETGSAKSQRTTTTTRYRPDGADDFAMERARRHAAAARLPDNSGIWALAEKQLFMHLAMRGFEPLLPTNWMHDFKTLPLSLFARKDTDPPLIHHSHGTEFRAIKALRDLLEIGKVIRDKAIASPGFNVEKTIQRSIIRYMEWSMHDAGIFPGQKMLPYHRFAIRKRGQATSQLLNELTDDLQELAQQHRDEMGTLPSIEVPQPTPTLESHGTTLQQSEDGLPVLFGLMVVSSLLVIFTYNPNIPTVKKEPAVDGTVEDDELGIRYIAKFDFSDASMDVWNSFAVAILCMQLRKTQLDRGVPTSPEKPRGKNREGQSPFDPDL